MLGIVPELWNDARFYVIGGGPSVADVDLNILRGKHVIVTNNAFKLAPWADVLYFMDCVWYDWNKTDLHIFRGLKFTTCNKLINAPGIIVLKHGHRNAVDMRPNYLSRGASSGQGAISLGIKLGGKEAVLIGFDMRIVDGRHNFHNEHKKPTHDNIYVSQHMRSLKMMIPHAEKLGVTIVNCTPGSAIDFIPNEPLEKWL